MRRYYLILLASGLSVMTFAQSSSHSYVKSRTITNASATTWLDHIDYDNGLGDLYQQVDVNITPGGNSLVTLHEYDGHRRPYRKWLPASITGSSIQSVSSVKSGSQTLNSDTKPYTQEEYELSPLNRLSKEYLPGANWQNNNKYRSMTRKVNSGSSVDNALGLTMLGNTLYFQYNPSTIYYVESTSDEDGRKTITFTDRNGKVAAVRNAVGSNYLTTYYAYNDCGDLRYVLPPEAAYYYENNNSMGPDYNDNKTTLYGYEYRYDSRHNCIYKRLPGCDPVYYVYDKAGRCILSQDGVQRASGKWTFYIPDAFGRTVLTGVCSNNITYTNEPLKNVVVKAYRSNSSGNILGYMVTYITLSQYSVYSANYYDNYSFITSSLAPTTLSYASPLSGYGTQGLTAPKGLLTGTAIGRLDSSGVSGYDYKAIYYDDRGRVIQTRSTNHKSGLDYEYIGYDYIGNVLKRQHFQMVPGTASQTETYTYEYDTAGRLTKTKHKLNTNSEVTLHQNTYNELGQLSQKTNGGISAATESYTYNVRSWLKTITAGTLFSETLYYNDTYGGSTPQYGGNVSAMTWKADSKTRGYKFTYDNFSRLTNAQYMENGSASTHYNTEYTYDRMGNLKTLKRYGKQDNGTYGLIDNMTYTYTGNQPYQIQDMATDPTYSGAFNFNDPINMAGEYTYDKNGNMTKDLNKNISSLGYNFLNLPTSITYSSGKSATYIYDATGKKLQTSYKASASATAVPTDYCGNMIYENGVLKQVLVGGGYLSVTGTPFYFYYLKDHLGNNRVVVSPAGTATQINHYYPFGGLFGESTGNTGQRYKYNGKEFDRTHGLDWYDYGARHMTPDVGRFTTIDPMAEKYYSISPYAYCANNPVNAIETEGKDITFLIASNGANGFGHMGAIIGNNSNYYYITAGATNTNWKIFSNSNQEGGISIFKIDSSSMKGAIEIVRNTDKVNSYYNDYLTFHTSDKMDEAMLNEALEKKNNFKKGEEFYNLYTNNCADIVKDIFEKGTGTKLEMGVSPIPNKNFSTITDNKEDIQKALNDKLDDEHKK